VEKTIQNKTPVCVEAIPIPSSNPYQSNLSPVEPSPTGLSWLPWSLLKLLAVVLILRGAFMATSWGLQWSAGFTVDSYFHAAIVCKDSIYAVTAGIGGVLLLIPHRLGWWLALVHWCWLVAYEIAVVAVAVALSWQIPVHHPPPALYRHMGLTALMALAGLSILLWPPIVRACRGPVHRPGLAVGLTLAACVAVAFGVNGWMSLR
jgi:hypothetical protein